ncbi:hypothetical protein [Nonomuraea cavernae]|uniref:hypothetical protein n=1 Tax=Nonomuraea cavernae TaxID=2045107 RepID=UPI003401550C
MSKSEILDLPSLPDGWAYRDLESLLENNGISYGIVQPGIEDPLGVPILRVKNIRNRKVAVDDVLRVSREIEDKYQRTRLRGGEVLLTLVGTVGESSIAPPSLAGWNVARAIAVLRVAHNVSNNWVHICLSSDLAQGYIRMWQTTTVQATLNLRDVRRIPIIMPPKKDREAITTLIGAIDEKIAVNDRIIDTCYILGDTLFRALRNSMSSMRRIGDLVARSELVFGDGYRTKRPELGKPGIPILRVAEVLNGRIEPSLQDCVRSQYRSAMGGKISQAGDVILTTKGTVGRVAVIQAHDPEFVYSPQVCYFRAPEASPLTSAYLFFWFRSGSFWSQAGSLKSQTDMADYLNLADIRSLSIEIPDSRESLALISKLGALEKMSAHRQRESRSLSILRDTLLPKLMSGEIKVRDAEKLVENAT